MHTHIYFHKYWNAGIRGKSNNAKARNCGANIAEFFYDIIEMELYNC